MRLRPSPISRSSGVPFGVPYPPGTHAAASTGSPAAIRARAARLAGFVGHHDFDTGQPMLSGDARIVDCGDVPGDPDDGAGNATRAEAAVRALLARDVVPVVLGGDDSIPIPVLAAYEGRGPITVLQVDAHLDFRDEVAGVRYGYSSPMRRASEMHHVGDMVQVGLRGVGSARAGEVADARARGNTLVTARELRERGVGWVLEQLPEGASVFISFDLDGLDPGLCPGVQRPGPGRPVLGRDRRSAVRARQPGVASSARRSPSWHPIATPLGPPPSSPPDW